MYYKGDLPALENLSNNSICIKEHNGIRKTNSEDDLYGDLVFVSNLSPVEYDIYVINAGQMVRYSKIFAVIR